jgi:hypothetical protein
MGRCTREPGFVFCKNGSDGFFWECFGIGLFARAQEFQQFVGCLLAYLAGPLVRKIHFLTYYIIAFAQHDAFEHRAFLFAEDVACEIKNCRSDIQY